MRPHNPVTVVTGYRRWRATGTEIGAGEVWGAAIDLVAERGETAASIDVGRVLQVYDRSAYLEFADPVADRLDRPGPALVLLGGPAFTGPLATRIDTGGPRSFRPDAFEAGDRCRLRTGGSTPGGHVVSIGRSLELAIDPAVVERETDPQPCYHDLGRIDRGDPVWTRSKEALEWLVASDNTDGLELADDLLAAVEGETGADELLSVLASAWARTVSTDTVDLPREAGVDLLGRGPGATPSGDDILAGVLLALSRTTEGPANDRVRAAGTELLEHAAGKTTTISTALLAQAVQGRTSEPIESGLRTLLSPGGSDDRWIEDVAATATVGHTSGIDTLLGTLLSVLLVAPDVSSV